MLVLFNKTNNTNIARSVLVHAHQSRPHYHLLYRYVLVHRIRSIIILKLIVIIRIVGFNPNATMNTAHHMLLYGCGEPGTTKTTW